ncbi:MAG: TetR/AcrR family transcriptional regulator [Spongiibacteraceae bacterium]
MQFDESLHTESLVYSSPRMFERRQRVMEVTRELIAECGHDGFNMRELCRRAKVAPQTVYKAFESKERLVALSIRQNFQLQAERLAYHYEAESIEGVVERLVVSDRNIRAVKAYAVGIVSIFFSQTADTDLRVAASYHITSTLQPWLNTLRQQGCIRRGVLSESLCDAMVSLLFGVALEWARGVVDDEEFLFSKLECLFAYACGATRGKGQKEISRYLTDLLNRKELVSAIITQVDAG